MAFDPNTAKLAFDPASAQPVEFDPSTAKPAGFDPATAQPELSPELHSYEPTLWDRVQDLIGPNKDAAAVEYAARKIAKEDGISVDEVYRQAGGSRPILNPEGRAPIRALAEGTGVVAEQLPDIPQEALHVVLKNIRGGDTGADDDFLDRAISATDTGQPKDADPNYESFQGIGRSLGYSLTTLAAGALAAAGGGAAAGPPGAIGGGMVGAGAVAYRASKDDFLERVKAGLDDRSYHLYGRKLNQKEWDAALEKYEAAAIKYGAWEAIPEAVSNLVFLKALSAPLKRASKSFLRQTLERAQHAVTQGLPSEYATETATGVGQSHAEVEAGLRDKPLTVGEAFKQQVVPTTLVSLGLGGAGAAAKTAYDFSKERLTKERPTSEPAAPEQAQPEPQETTLEDIAQAEGADLDAMVDEYLAEPENLDLPVPDVEAFHEEVAAAEAQSDQEVNQQVTELPPENTGDFAGAEIQSDRLNVPRATIQEQVQQDSVSDRRQTERGTDRRDPKRPILEKLTPEERDIMLRSDVIPSLPGKRAFELHMEDNPGQRVMFLDYDDFKTINDKRGEKETDRSILEPSGEIMQEVRANFPDVSIFHRSGDEFLATGASDQRLQEFAAALRERLKTAKFEAILPDGSLDTQNGVGFSYGLGQDEETSRAAAKQQKAARKASGERVGARDAESVAGSAPAGDQVQAGEVNEHLQEQTQTPEEVAPAFDPSTAQLDRQAEPAPAVASATETQQRTSQTETPEFKKWFGSSKVVDENGEPLVVYHGTDADFTTFDGSRLGEKGAKPASIGFWFSDDAEYSKVHGDKVMPVYLSMQNPYVVKNADELQKLGADKERVAQLKKQGYDGVMVPASEEKLGKQTVRNAAIYAVFNPSQIKSAIGNSGRFDPNDPNILHANPIGAVYKGYQRLAQSALKRVNDAWGWKMSPLGKLPAQDLYLKERYETLGKIADVEAISKRVYETFRNLDAREAELVYEYFTTKDADDSKLSTKPVKYEWKGEKVESTVRKQAITIKKLINRVGQNLVDRGLLSKESHEKYEDSYLPRVYMKHLLGEGAGRSFAGGKKPSDMGYLKERKDIPKDVRELILGEITDPGYLASKSLGKSMRDLAVLDWFDEIAQNPDWAMQDFLVDYKGKKASIFWLKAESARIKEQIPYYKPANQQKAQAIVQQMDAIVQAGEAKLGKVTDAYRQVPDTAQYGRLRGMFIRKEIYNDITGIPGNRDPNAEWWQAPFEYGGIGTKATQLWKMSKVALNPPTQIRNFISNGILLQLSGVGSHRVLPLMVQAIQEIRQNGKYFRIAKKYGITGSTFANNELYRIEREFLDLKAKNAGKLSMAQMKRVAGIVADTAGDMYQLSEAVWKTAKIIDAMKREGKGEVEAVLDAQKWLYDYSLVPQTVRYFRNTPIGIPFLTFYYKTLPRMLEVAATAPHRFAPYVAIPALFTAIIASQYDVDPEDVEKLKKALPEWLQDHGHLFFLPYKDQHGRWQAFDFSYLLPWSMFEQVMNNLKKGEVGEAVQTSGVLGGPVVDMISAIRTNIDPFTKKPIVDKSDPPAMQAASIMNYLWSLAAPTWLTENGAIKKMYDAVMGNVNPKTGEPQLTVPQAALRFAGLNMYPIEPEESRRKNISMMGFEISEIEKRMGERLKDRTLDTEDKRKIREVYQELIREKREQLKDYKAASEIHPNLKGEPVKKKAANEYQG